MTRTRAPRVRATLLSASSGRKSEKGLAQRSKFIAALWRDHKFWAPQEGCKALESLLLRQIKTISFWDGFYFLLKLKFRSQASKVQQRFWASCYAWKTYKLWYNNIGDYMKKFNKLQFIAALLFLISIILDIIQIFNESLIVLNFISLPLLITALIIYLIIFIKEKRDKQ